MTTSRVAYLCADPGIPPDSTKGASVHFRSMAKALLKNGVDLDVFMTRKGSVDPFLPHRGLVVPTPRASGIQGELLQFAHSSTLLEAMNERGPHSAVYERMSLFSAGGLAYAQQHDIPLVVEVNAPLWIEAAQFRSLHLGKTAEALCIDVLQGATAVFSVSAALARMLVEAGAPEERVHVLGNGADLANFQGASPQPRPPQLHGKPMLVFAGSLKPWHGTGFLLEAFAALRSKRECGLWIIGDGPAREQVEAAAAAAPNDIVCEGAIPHEKMGSYLAAADAICAPYTSESPSYFSPLKIVEGLAAGKPLLCSRVPCVLGELQGHELPGLFEPDSIVDFVRAAERVLDAPDRATAHDLVQGLDWAEKAKVVMPWLQHQPGASDGG